MSVVEVRRAAYATVAGAILGRADPGADVEEAIALVLADTRKSRSKAERALQMHLSITLVLWGLMRDAGKVADYADRLRGILDAARGGEAGP